MVVHQKGQPGNTFTRAEESRHLITVSKVIICRKIRITVSNFSTLTKSDEVGGFYLHMSMRKSKERERKINKERRESYTYFV